MSRDTLTDRRGSFVTLSSNGVLKSNMRIRRERSKLGLYLLWWNDLQCCWGYMGTQINISENIYYSVRDILGQFSSGHRYNLHM